MGRGRWGGGNRNRETGKGAKRRGRRRCKRRQMDMKKCLGGMRLQHFLTVYPCNAGYPS